jgi:Fe2+ or Zn2+ uptake regulation protein
MPGPINTMILEIIREAGKPLHTNELVERLQARGKDADPATVTNAVAHLVRAGKLWRTAPKTFGLPKGVGL